MLEDREDEIQGLLQPVLTRHGVPLLCQKDKLEAIKESLADLRVVNIEEVRSDRRVRAP